MTQGRTEETWNSCLDDLIRSKRIIICTGAGGVGKTTTAAALGLHAARSGRRCCVVTIDPAKRLGDALGVSGLTNEPTLVQGSWSGQLWATMLDTKTTFDKLVIERAATSQQAETILTNRLYRNISAALSGTQEYMAMEKLHELHEKDDFDLIVVDTPPTRHALDFLEAPGRLTRFLDNRVFRLLMTPTRAGLLAANIAANILLKTISKVVGGQVVTDAVTFFNAFGGMEAGFKARAENVVQLLGSKTTAFVVVCTPRTSASEEATFFAERLQTSGMQLEALVVNQVQHRFHTIPSPDPTPEMLALLYANLEDLATLSAAQEAHVERLKRDFPQTPLIEVPHLAGEIYDLAGLTEVADQLTRPVRR